MQDNFLYYYNNELTSIRKLAQEFAHAHPKVAGNLHIAPGSIEDPLVGRLLESLAFLTAQINYKLDGDLPELAETLLDILYPHYQAPLPSFSIIQLTGLKELETGYRLDKNTLLETKPAYQPKCRFNTLYPVTLWPIQISKAKIMGLPLSAPVLTTVQKTLGLFQISLECFTEKLTFSQLRPDHLRFYLDLSPPHSYMLYELIFNHTIKIGLANSVNDREPVFLDKNCLKTVGFSPEDGLLPYSTQASMGYKNLIEYFAFPEKYLFFEVDLGNSDVFKKIGNKLELFFYLNKSHDELEKIITTKCIKLGCTPIVNLFKQIAEPIQYSHLEPSYRVIPDAHRVSTMEVYSIKNVTALTNSGKAIKFFPFYGIMHSLQHQAEKRFWQSTRKKRITQQDDADSITEVFLSFTDSEFDPQSTDRYIMQIETLCTDGDLPAALPFGGNESYFQLDAAAPISKIDCLIPLTKTKRPNLKNESRWKLISHLSFNYLSLSQKEYGLNIFKEIMSLYNYLQSAEAEKNIDGLVSLDVKRITSRNPGNFNASLCQGIEINLTVDEEKFSSKNLYLFSQVLENFFAEYASINSFTKLVIISKQSEGILFQWQPRSGNTLLL